MPSKACVECNKYRPIFSQGRCRECFVSWGTLTGIDPSLFPPKCNAEGCDRYVEKKGYCDKHYRRFLDHGHTDKVKVISDARKNKEYRGWLRLKALGALCEEWLDFWVFLKDVGPQPFKGSRLSRPSFSELYGPTNFQWTMEEQHKLTPEEKKMMQRERNKRRDHTQRNLKKYYGINKEQYDSLLEQQNGGCLFCGATTDISSRGKPQTLAVDHCHSTGEIRGLLCRNHNAMLGFANDDPVILRKAADYLEQKKYTGLFTPVVGDALPEGIQGVRNETGTPCSAENCSNKAKAHGYCQKHYMRLRNTGSVELKKKTLVECAESGCNQMARAKGFCLKHYAKRRRETDTVKRQPLVCQ